MTYHQIGIEDFKTLQRLAQVAGGELLLPRHSDRGFLRLNVFDRLLQVNSLEVKVMLVTSSLTPGMVSNSCLTPSIRIDEMA